MPWNPQFQIKPSTGIMVTRAEIVYRFPWRWTSPLMIGKNSDTPTEYTKLFWHESPKPLSTQQGIHFAARFAPLFNVSTILQNARIHKIHFDVRSRIEVSHSSRDLSALLASRPPSLIRPPATGTNHLASGGHHVHPRTIPINISTSLPRRPFHAFPSFFRSSDRGILQHRTLPSILRLHPVLQRYVWPIILPSICCLSSFGPLYTFGNY